MRKLIIIVAVMMAPVAVYVAGCRRDGREAAFPKGPEVKGLARKADAPQGVPEIAVRPATIDREILASHDEATGARIQMVRDTEARLASVYDSPGLFTSEPGGHVLAAAPRPAPYQATPDWRPEAPHNPTPATVGPEFWSRSPAYAPIAQQPREVPADVYAMAPARMPEALPEPVPVAQTAAVWASSAPTPVPEAIVFPEAVPGVYTGGVQALEPPPLFEIPGDPADWLGQTKFPEARRPAPILAPAGFESVNLEYLAGLIQEPVKPTAPATSPAGSELGARLAALLNNTDIRQALEPLPVLASGEGGAAAAIPHIATTSIPAKPLPALAALETPPSPTEQLIPDLTALLEMTDSVAKDAAAVKAEETIKGGTAFVMPPPPLDAPAPALKKAAATRDDYRLDVDFWESKLPPVDVTLRTETFEPPVDLGHLASLDAPATPEAKQASLPQRVTFVPMRPLLEKPRPRNSALERIDASTEVPPLRF